ncbi:unnamed protein product [Cylicocyclus nassatus]|uniref:Uncharacterized protein n=1 Tax=Cylicocyclus nassatus TaxID=53992 RepID=A0AA36GXR9_CYLNA|nr:unnamed protein product [Cylicocyclus nassatus]
MKCSLTLVAIATLCILLTVHARNSRPAVKSRDVLRGPPPFIPPFKPVERPQHGPYPQPQAPQPHQPLQSSLGSAFQSYQQGGSGRRLPSRPRSPVPPYQPIDDGLRRH